MEQLIELVAGTCGVASGMIKGRKRHGRRVSYAKMIFCLAASESYRAGHREIARFLGCSRESVYYLLSAARRNQEYDREFRELAERLALTLRA